MTDISHDKRRKLGPEDRMALAYRYWTRHRRNETVDSVANAFGVSRVHATNVAQEIGEEAALAAEAAQATQESPDSPPQSARG